MRSEAEDFGWLGVARSVASKAGGRQDRRLSLYRHHYHHGACSSRVRTREDSGLRGKRGSDGDGASLWRVLLEISESWRQGSAILSHSMAS